MNAAIDYYFAPQSPYAYLGHARFVDLLKRFGATARVKPVDMNRVFSVSGGLPLGQRAAQRRAYRLVELRRFSHHLGVPLNLQPRYFPVSGDPAARLLLAADANAGAARALELAGAIGKALWVEECDISDPDTLIRIATHCNFDGHSLFQASAQPAISEHYEALTDEAIAAQVFGAPTYVFAGELFWGQDRLDFLERAMARS